MDSTKQTFSYWKSGLDEIWLEQMAIIHKGKNIEQACLEAYGHLISDEARLANADHSDFKRLVNGWLANKRFPQKTTTAKLIHQLK